MIASIIIFFMCSLVNVMLNTLKAIIIAKSDSKLASMIINAVTFGFYAIVIKQLSSFDLSITVIVTILTNLIGVYISMLLIEKLTKDKLWKISITSEKDISTILDKYPTIPYSTYKTRYGADVYYSFDIFSNCQADSELIKKILEKHKIKKYTVIEINKKL